MPNCTFLKALARLSLSGWDHDVAELFREAKDTNCGLEELGGAMEVGELESDLAVGVGGLEGGDDLAEGGEGGVSFPDGNHPQKSVIGPLTQK
ncbi:hypothetical protein Acr_26g0000230 [Actinidia rufa]|uniref:Uncharacterized protein n=1 Tax=Actinidia rufa TaxID=165716 RepID=A0A7J0H0Y7_9ERIC|nr:hypothetical protein Acr_26g0000230 [Actinidia rufa]